MATAQVVKVSVTVNNSPALDFTPPDNHNYSTHGLFVFTSIFLGEVTLKYHVV